MKIPEPRKMSSGKWFIQLRLGGESITVSNFDRKTCIRDAAAIKAEYLAGKRSPQIEEEPSPTLTKAIDAYIESKSNTLSPSTLRGYRAIQKHRFKTTMLRKIDEIQDSEWQTIINAEVAIVSPTTVRKAFAFVRTVILHQTGHNIPMEHITLPAAAPAKAAFLTPDEITKFVAAVKDTRYAVPALLALSSLRISEIQALRWENIPTDPDFIRVAGAVVRGVDSTWAEKKQNKNTTSTRNVPVLIPELKAAIKRDRKLSGPIMDMDQDSLRVGVHKICKETGITDVTIHGLRHSFASLAYHLQMPEKIAMEIGGWADASTMHNIYTHISKSDITRYQTEMANFYSNKGKKKKKNAK